MWKQQLLFAGILGLIVAYCSAGVPESEYEKTVDALAGALKSKPEYINVLKEYQQKLEEAETEDEIKKVFDLGVKAGGKQMPKQEREKYGSLLKQLEMMEPEQMKKFVSDIANKVKK